MLVLHPLPVVAQDARRVRDLGGIRDQHPAVAQRAQVLRRIEAEGAGQREAAGPLAPPDRAVRLAGILDHLQSAVGGQRQDGLHVGDAAEQMHRDDRAGSRRDGGGHCIGVHRAVGIAIDEHRARAHRKDGADGGDERVRLGDHVVASTYAGGAQRQLERRESGIDAHRIGRVAVRGELALEGLEVLPQDEVAAVEHRLDRRHNGRLQGLRLCPQVHEVDAECSSHRHDISGRRPRC